MNPDPTLTRAADETAGGQPEEASPPGEAASAPQAAAATARRAVRRYELERSRLLTMMLLDHLAGGIEGKQFGTAQDSVDKLKDPFLAMNRMQRELRRIVAYEEQLDAQGEKRALAAGEEDDDEVDEACADALTDPAVAETRRASRRADLDRSLKFTSAMCVHLAVGLTGLSVGAAHDCVQRLKDPFLAINRMQRELRRIIALADLLDDNDDAWTKRFAADAAAAEEDARDAELDRAAAIQNEKDEAKKAAIHQAVTEAARDAWGDEADDEIDEDDEDYEDRLSLSEMLDDLFDDYDTYEGYKEDPVVIVAKMCDELGMKPAADPAADPDATEEERALELARSYLEQVGWQVTPASAVDADEGQDEIAHDPPDG